MEGKPFSGDPQPDQKTVDGKPVAEAADVAQSKSLEEVEYGKYLLPTSSVEETILQSQRKEKLKKEVIQKQPSVKRKLAFPDDAPSQQYQGTALAVPLHSSPVEECELGVRSLSITDDVPVQKKENSSLAIPKQNIIATEKKEEYSDASSYGTSVSDIEPWKCSACKFVNYESAEVCDVCYAVRYVTLEKCEDADKVAPEAQGLATESAQKMSERAIPKQTSKATKRKEEYSDGSSCGTSASDIEPWECSACKFVNFESAEVCDVCGTVRYGYL